MPLALAYIFTPDPQPIYVSVGGADPNVVAVNVTVSNPSMSAVTLKKITIEIPVGQEIAADLSTQNLPPPTYTGTLCQIASSGNTITLSPPAGFETITLTGSPILCVLPGIQVNETPGSVPITITEFPVSGPKQTDHSQTLVKQPTTSAVINFYARPSLLTNLEEKTTLFWACNDEGKNYSYSVRTENYSWQPRDCLEEGTCYGVQDGINGVPSAVLQQEGVTTFALDVISTDEDGNRSVVATLTTDVQVIMPSIAEGSYQNVSPSGQMVRLHWLALNTAYCTVALDDKIIDANAPIDTYLQGYTVVVSGAAGTVHQLTVNAFSQGGAQAFVSFPEITLTAPSPISVGNTPQAISFTPDGKFALVANGGDNTVTVIDIAGLAPEARTIPVGFMPNAIAITPDGTLALVTNQLDNDVTVIDIAGRIAEAKTIPVGETPYAIAITLDGALALVVNGNSGTVTVIDIAGRVAEAKTIPVGKDPFNIAVTSDGTLALVTNGSDNSVTVIDIAGRKPEVGTISVGLDAVGIAITSDGTLALVLNLLIYSASVIDIANRTVEARTIPVGLLPSSVVFTPDNMLALVMNSGSKDITVIDIADRKAEAKTIPVSNMADLGIAIAPNGTLVLVATAENTVVAI